jgi:hypothetical protein
VNPGAELILQTTGGPATQVGWAQLLTTGGVTGSAVFSQAGGGALQEAVALVENRTPSAFLLSFDNTANYATGVAVANLSGTSMTVPFVIRDDSGATLLSGSLVIAGLGHTSFVLSGNYPVTAARRGTMEFDAPPNGQISVIGFRFGPTGGISTIPALTQ